MSVTGSVEFARGMFNYTVGEVRSDHAALADTGGHGELVPTKAQLSMSK